MKAAPEILPLPCPHCGYAEVTVCSDGSVFCDPPTCGATAPSIAAWNRRPPFVSDLEELRGLRKEIQESIEYHRGMWTDSGDSRYDAQYAEMHEHFADELEKILGDKK